MIATECSPVAQAGGLGEVIFGLSGELELRGNAVEIIMPKYDCMRCDQIFGLSVAYQDLWVPWYSGSVHCTVWLGWVIHCHDCQTAVVPVLLYEIYQHLGMHNRRVCYTIHNFAHQGICGEYVLWATGLSRPEHFFDDDRLRDNFNHGAINLMKA